MSRASALVVVALLVVATAPARAQSFEDWYGGQRESLLSLYRDLHRHPELSFHEVKTSARIADELEAAGFTVTRHVGGLGVVAVLVNGDGPTTLLRTDLDALPIGECTGLDYMSEDRHEDEDGRVQGVMHACGHDVHMTCLVGSARWLASHRDAWHGTAVLIGQPAEERSGGANAMLADGLFERFPRPDRAIALHVAHDLAAGDVGLCPGPAMANVESCDVLVKGRGGHGAAPHLTIDPIVIASELVLDLQTIVARELDPTDAAVVTVGSIHGGSKHNIIDSECRLQITIRSYDDDVHEHIKRAIERKAKAAAAGARAPEPDVTFSEYTPALINDVELTARLRETFRTTLGADHVLDFGPVMTAEDFGRYGRAGVPICMFRLGSVSAERLAAMRQNGEAPPSLHSAHYWPDPDLTVRTGIRCLTAAVAAGR